MSDETDPARMLSSFRSRIIAVLVGLVAVAEIATIGPALTAARSAALDSAEQELRTGGVLFSEIFRSRGEQLAGSVGVLASDFGFRDAVMTGDVPTIESALENHAGRVEADLAMLLDLDGEILGATAETLASGRLTSLLESMGGSERLHSVLLLDGAPYEFVLVPVRAPLQVGWTGMGFKLDEALTRELKELTGLEVSFVGSSGRGLEYYASTLPAGERAASVEPVPFPEQARGRFFSHRIPLYERPGELVAALLQVPVERMFAEFEALRTRLVLLAALTLVICCLGAVVLARQMSRPVAQLARSAERIEAGDYFKPIEIRDRGEFGLLARAFNRMQSGIAEREARLIHQSEHDPMTGLPNRRGIGERLRSAMAAADSRGSCCALLMIDVNRFKEINDTLGHEVGDQAIMALAQHLRGSVRADDAVVRLDGDEFLIIAPGADAESAKAIAASLICSLGDSISLSSLKVSVRLSAGIAVYPEHSTDAEKLLRCADIAMYAAKESEHGISVYVEGDDERHLHRIAVINALQQAIEQDVFEIHYQPKVDLRTHETTHAEALIRWHHPELGRIGPDEFIPLAEQSGNIKRLTRLVLGHVARQLRAWRDEGIDLVVSVNLSALDVVDRELPSVVFSALDAHGLAPDSLIVEVTESAVLRDSARAVQILGQLRDSGVMISIDDFGTGQSSLAQLKQLPVDELKIDKSFVTTMAADPDNAVICKSTIELGHQMGLAVVAEGVEDEAAFALLARYGCEMAQGFWIARPLPAPDVAPWLRARGSAGRPRRSAPSAGGAVA